VGARRRERERYHFEALCDLVVYSHEEGIQKPDRRMYAIVCERLGVLPGEALFLDDREVCVEGARRAGMVGVRFRDNHQAMREIEAHLASR
jgi:putative hydrolase of the HAD superfamily